MRLLRWIVLAALLPIAALGQTIGPGGGGVGPGGGGGSVTVPTAPLLAGAGPSTLVAVNAIAGIPISGSTGAFTTLSASATATLFGIAGPASGNMSITLGNATQTLLIKNSANAQLLDIGGTLNEIMPLVPTILQPTVTLSGASYVISTNAQIFANSTVSGSPTFTTLQYDFNSLSGTDNLTPTGGGSVASVAMLQLGLSSSANTSRNLYTIDATATVPVTPLSTNVEAHAGRFTTVVNANMGGTNSSTLPGGNAIGLKANTTLSAAATFLNLVTGIEVQLNNAAVSGPAVLQYGEYIQSSSSVQGAVDDAGLAIFGQTTGFIGYKTSLLFGSQSASNKPPTGSSGTGALIGTANSGTPWTATTGVDLSQATFTGNTWQDGHVTISGAGAVSAVSYAVGATAGVTCATGLPTAAFSASNGIVTHC